MPIKNIKSSIFGVDNDNNLVARFYGPRCTSDDDDDDDDVCSKVEVAVSSWPRGSLTEDLN